MQNRRQKLEDLIECKEWNRYDGCDIDKNNGESIYKDLGIGGYGWAFI